MLNNNFDFQPYTINFNSNNYKPTEAISSELKSLIKESNRLCVKRYAEIHQKSICIKLRSILDPMMFSADFRISDLCNILLVFSGVKPSCLVVFSNLLDALQLSKSLFNYTKHNYNSFIHFDPEVNKFYVIIWDSKIKAYEAIQITKNFCSYTRTDNYFTVKPCAEYHLSLGRFLDVPECCLVSRPVELIRYRGEVVKLK